MSLLAAASCPLVEHYQLTSKPGATRFRAAVRGFCDIDPAKIARGYTNPECAPCS